MDYQKIYDQIVQRGKNRILEGYSESHHILPKSLGGTNLKENLVKLTAREHFICHHLLTKIYSGKQKAKMIHAWWRMCQKNGTTKHIPTSRQYTIARNLRLPLISGKNNHNFGKSGWTLGKKRSLASRLKQSTSCKGKKLLISTKNAIGKANTGKIRTAQVRQQMSIDRKGKPGKKHTKETKLQISEKLLGVKHNSERVEANRLGQLRRYAQYRKNNNLPPKENDWKYL